MVMGKYRTKKATRMGGSRSYRLIMLGVLIFFYVVHVLGKGLF